MSTGSNIIVRRPWETPPGPHSQLRRGLLGSIMVAAGVVLLVISSAFFLGEGPAAGLGLDSTGAEPAADASLADGSAIPASADVFRFQTVDVRYLRLGAGVPAWPAEVPEKPSIAPEGGSPPPSESMAALLPSPAEPSPAAAAPPVNPTLAPVSPTLAPASPTAAPRPTVPPPPPTATPQPPAPPPASLSTFEYGILAGVNAERVAAGLPPLQLDSALVMVARERSNDMVQKGYFGHVSPTGETAFTLMDRYGIPYGWAGENLARNNYPDDETVAVALRDWMASQGHRDNILSPHYSKIGVGAAVDGAGMKYFTLVFVGL